MTPPSSLSSKPALYQTVTNIPSTIVALPSQPRAELDAEYVKRLIARDLETEQHFRQYFGDRLSLQLRPRLRAARMVEDVKQTTFARVLAMLKHKGGLEECENLGALVNAVCNTVLFEAWKPVEDPRHEPASIGTRRFQGRTIAHIARAFTRASRRSAKAFLREPR